MRRASQFAAGIVLVLASPHAFAETTEIVRTTAWTWSPYITVPIFSTALMYGLGLGQMRRRGSKLRLFPILCFAGGLLSLFLALDSPVHEISEQLFWVHMTQHEILMLVSAPLLILTQPAAPYLFALPERWRVVIANIGKMKTVDRAWLVISAPFAAWMLHAIALWGWHAPRLFDATLQSEWVHAA